MVFSIRVLNRECYFYRKKFLILNALNFYLFQSDKNANLRIKIAVLK